MLVDLKQYRHEDVQGADNKAVGESQTEDTVDKSSEEYFGENIDEFDLETWETVDHQGTPIERRYVTISGVTAVSLPDEPTDEDDPDLPGRTIQLRLGGGVNHLPQAELVEVEDENPQGSEPAGKVSVEDEP